MLSPWTSFQDVFPSRHMPLITTPLLARAFRLNYDTSCNVLTILLALLLGGPGLWL